MLEVREREREPSSGLEGDDLPKLVYEIRLPVRREPHDLVLIAVFRKPEILGDGEIKQTKRVRKEHAIENLELRAPPHRERSAHEISEPVDGADRRILEGR